MLCVPEIAPRDVSDVSCVAIIKYECRIFIVFCILEIAARNENDVLYVVTIKQINIL